MFLPIALAALLTAGMARAATVPVSADVAANTTWFATNTYVLQTVVYVKSNVTLTIEPGTVIKAATGGLIARDGIPNLVAALWVTRGGKLNAAGTVDNPIIFTYDGDNVNNPTDVPFNTSGQWGGIVLCGRALINSAQSTAGNVASPKYERLEGTTTDGVDGAHLFGGSDDSDNSGVMRYVSIRYPGTVFAPARELNGLTMGAVGKGTDISYVEVIGSSDDAFEWWGGCVNTHHLVAAFCEDDDFDTDQGYRGTNQFWFGIKPPWSGSTDSRGLETDGDLNQSASGELPKSQWTVHNVTLIGRGKTATGFGGGIGWNARDEAAPNVLNSIFAEFAAGVKVDTDGTNEFFTGLADLRHSIFDVGTALSDANADYLFSAPARMNTLQPALLGGISYTNNMGLNPRPAATSPALTNVAAQGAGLTATTYRGAFGRYDQWADGWTALSQLGYLGDGRNPVPVATDISANTTWFATNTYVLQTVVYVKSNVTLTIEPGTVIKAATGGLIARDGIPNLVAALWVTRGGKLNAAGTVDNPIIFTYDGDNVNNPTDVPFNTSGQWGGIVLCGRALINSAQSTAGNVASPKYERLEGTTTDGVDGAHLFGGSDDSDNSGVMRYVSIRYPGTVFAPARELNGLTMGAVGKGTDISYVEVIGSSDDAFEWWGGCVNTHHLVAAFCEDDDFDTDQGYRGTNQFWFGIKPPWSGSTDSRGLETDGDLNQSASGELPKSQWTVHNVTLIGRGKTATGFGGGIGWNARDEAAPNVLNSIFAEFAAGVKVDTDGTNEFFTGLADLRHSIFDVGTALSDANADYLFSAPARMNTLQPALLGGISYTNNMGLNPRPAATSPALTNVAAQGAGLTATTYRGAFGTNDQWALGWTALYRLGYLQGVYRPAGNVVNCVPSTLAITQNGGDVMLSFASVATKSYRLLGSNDAATPLAGWSQVSTLVAGGNTASFTVPAAGAHRFFIVICE